MKFQDGFAYHIKDEYFIKANDAQLMQNKEGGTYRPTFLCLSDEKTGLLWMVPMSTRVEKYQAIHDKHVEKYGKSLTIVMGEYDGKKAAFLLQNMFPVTEDYIDHVHTKNGNPVPVKYSVHKAVKSNMQQLRRLIDRGKRVVFTDVKRLEKLMIDELSQKEKSKAPEPKSMKERINEAATEAKRREEQKAVQKQNTVDSKLECKKTDKGR